METLKHELLRLALVDVTGKEVRKVYGRAIDRFCLWLSEQGARNFKMKDLCNEHKLALVKEYISFLTNMGVPRFCVITYLKPVCKAFRLLLMSRQILREGFCSHRGSWSNAGNKN